MVSLLVELFRQADTLFRTGHDTELAAFATFLINRNLSHDGSHKKIYGTQIYLDEHR